MIKINISYLPPWTYLHLKLRLKVTCSIQYEREHHSQYRENEKIL